MSFDLLRHLTWWPTWLAVQLALVASARQLVGAVHPWVCHSNCVVCVEPNDESAANVDAAKTWREDRTRFNEIAERTVRKSLGLWRTERCGPLLTM